MEANQILEKGNSGSGKRPKADWNEKNYDIFMNVCIEQWQLWERLKGKETGIGWDYISRTVTASDAWWQPKIEEYPEAAKFKDKGLRNLPEMEVLFKDIVATGIHVDELDAQVQETSPSLQRPKRKRDGKNYKRGVASRMCEQFDSVIESLNSDNAIIVNVPKIVDCLDMLKHLPGLEFGSETHILGIRLMKSKANREIFVALDDPILRLNWIKSHNLADLSHH
ncbi:hypothetical protein QL285_015376 [Trifolium repens]|nr:hypothetical protein QL285_015376 [Trifolium repens]